MRILVADDDRPSRTLLQRVLEAVGHEVVACSDGLQAWTALQRHDPPRLAVLDWMMPGMEGLEVILRLRAEPRATYTYLVLLTGRSEKCELLRGLEAGADDYLVKPFHAGELIARVQVGQRIIELENRLIGACEQARFQAEHDELTQIYNRRAILKVLERELSRGSREKTTTALLLIDVDHFKQVNDSHGHVAGDVALRTVAEILRRTVRPYDEVGRYGGEEFVIVAPRCGLTQAIGLAERVRNAVNAQKIHVGAEVAIRASVSIGVSVGSAESVDSLLQAADVALYRAKTSGRNCVCAEKQLPLPANHCHPSQQIEIPKNAQFSSSRTTGGSHE